MIDLAGLLLALQMLTMPAAPLEIRPLADAERLGLGRDAAARMTLPVRINEQGPFPFLLDTASDRSLLSDTLTRRLGLPAADGVVVLGIEGRRPVATALVETLQLGRRDHHGLAAPILPGAALGADGLIGLDTLAGETVILDFEKDQISIARSEQEALIHEPDVIVVTARSRFGQLILTDARIGRTRITAIIDTGAETTIGNLALRRLLGRSGPLVGDGDDLVGVTGGRVVAESGEVPRIRIGGIAIETMPIAFADIATFRHFEIDDRPAILLGMDMLRRFRRVAIDFRRRSIRFQLGRTITPVLRADGAGSPTPVRDRGTWNWFEN